MKLTSAAFAHNGDIPAKYTCQGQNVSPPLEFSGVPNGAQSLVLTVDDPDAATDPDGPDKTFDHWVLFNIDPKTASIAENSSPPAASIGATTSSQRRYTGPCPPNGKHRYFFKLYALDIRLDVAAGATKTAVETAMDKHVLGQAELVGLYQKT